MGKRGENKGYTAEEGDYRLVAALLEISRYNFFAAQKKQKKTKKKKHSVEWEVLGATASTSRGASPFAITVHWDTSE